MNCCHADNLSCVRSMYIYVCVSVWLVGRHRWLRAECMVCPVCEECTGYGSSCVSSATSCDQRTPGQYVVTLTCIVSHLSSSLFHSMLKTFLFCKSFPP